MLIDDQSISAAEFFAAALQEYDRATLVGKMCIRDRDGTECKPAKLEILETEPELRVRVTLKEGKYHQVKRMIAAVGGTVTALKRLRLGGLWLDKTLAPGEFRELTQDCLLYTSRSDRVHLRHGRPHGGG